MELYSTCFLGVPLTNQAKQEFITAQNLICSLLPAIVPADKWLPHLTFYYLGSQDKQAITQIMSRAQRHIELLRSEKLHIGKLGVFREHDPRVVYLQVHHSSNVEQFYRVMCEELSSYRVEQATRDFHPHITIGRLPTRESQGEFSDAEGALKIAAETIEIEMVIDRICLFGIGDDGKPRLLAEIEI